jgi:hypothetical protein
LNATSIGLCMFEFRSNEIRTGKCEVSSLTKEGWREDIPDEMIRGIV